MGGLVTSHRDLVVLTVAISVLVVLALVWIGSRTRDTDPLREQLAQLNGCEGQRSAPQRDGAPAPRQSPDLFCEHKGGNA
jgi:hypothetical protein